MSRHNRERKAKLPQAQCLSCGLAFNFKAAVGTGPVNAEGDCFAVCGSCGEVHVLKSGQIRRATVGERFAVEMRDAEFIDIGRKVIAEEEEKDRVHILEHNRLEVERFYREAVAGGCERPVIHVLDLRYGLARKIGEAVHGRERVEEEVGAVSPDAIPTLIVAMSYEYVETPMRQLMSAEMFGVFQGFRNTSGRVIAVVVSGGGNLLASWEPAA